MVFDYYYSLSASDQVLYRRSDAVTRVALGNTRQLRADVRVLSRALDEQHRRAVEQASRRLLRGLSTHLEVPPLRVTVLAARPHDEYRELHGLYESAHARRRAAITLWMRTARRQQVVAFRTYLRTLLHEFCHHLDYTLLEFEDSLHTEGFYKRETSLFNQLVR